MLKDGRGDLSLPAVKRLSYCTKRALRLAKCRIRASDPPLKLADRPSAAHLIVFMKIVLCDSPHGGSVQAGRKDLKMLTKTRENETK